MAFPEGFLWGGSPSSAQIKGGYDCDGRGSSIWDVEQLNEETCSFHYASDFYHHWEEGITLVAEMGFKAYRTSISWSRILPDGENEINQKGIDSYKAVFVECRKYDIEPIVTIFHFDLPPALEKGYGNWNNRRVMDTYVVYCRVLFSKLKEDVTHWLTYNEQNMLIFFGAVDMIGGSGRVQNLDALYNQAHVQLVAQTKAIHLCHELCPNAKIGPAPDITASYPKSHNPVDYIAAMNMDDPRNSFYLDTLVFGKYPGSVNHHFELNDIQIRTEEGDFECTGTCHPDFIGFSYYGNDTTEYLPYFGTDYEAMLCVDNRKVSHLMKLIGKPGIGRAMQNEYLMNPEADGHSSDPYCIRVTARRLTQRYHLPVLITENGYGREDILEADGSIHDSYRIEHLRETIRQMRIGIEEGTDIVGHCPWSTIDLVSVRKGISKRYGFVCVDRNEDDNTVKTAEIKRYRKDSFYWYRRVIASNDAELEE